MIEKSAVRNEYPRPDFERKEWLNLNGEWEFEFDDNNIGEKEKWYETGVFHKKIIVPFCYQSKMSGIDNQDFHEVLWYKKMISMPVNFSGKKVFLNFGAVDYYTKVWVNGEYAGEHKGGHVSFKLDITNLLTTGDNKIVVRAEDKYDTAQPRGKQYWKRKNDRCWYTPTSGIWQTVWLETSGNIYIDKLRMTPDIDRKNIQLEVFLNEFIADTKLKVSVFYKGESIKELVYSIDHRVSRCTIDLREEDYIDEIHYWSPENPNLYDIQFTVTVSGSVVDNVKSYFGMRKIALKGDMILLNNRPYYQKLILDQGYWPESLLTPPSDEAIRFDIEMTKKFGFNGARKHQKIEDPRYYYWADKLGLLVWGEMPSAYDYGIEEVENLTREWKEFINRDYNHPCIVAWVPLNESWGVRNIVVDKAQQNFAAALYHLTKAMDSTRLVSSNDGWEMVEATDICAIHDYEAWGENFTKKFSDKDEILGRDAVGRMIFAEGHSYNGRPIMLTEYGGIAFKSESEENWGYFGSVEDEEAFMKRYSSITGAVRNTPYIRGYCYTQLTDVMQEVNGLMTADRRVKVDPEKIKIVNL